MEHLENLDVLNRIANSLERIAFALEFRFDIAMPQPSKVKHKPSGTGEFVFPEDW
jgi:hypothetical protein